MLPSIILPTSNEARLLPRALRSVHAALAEVSHPGEGFVVDNNSTDARASLARMGFLGLFPCATRSRTLGRLWYPRSA